MESIKHRIDINITISVTKDTAEKLELADKVIFISWKSLSHWLSFLSRVIIGLVGLSEQRRFDIQIVEGSIKTVERHLL